MITAVIIPSSKQIMITAITAPAMIMTFELEEDEPAAVFLESSTAPVNYKYSYVATFHIIV